MSRFVLVVAAVLLAGCPRPPAPLSGEFPPTTVADARSEDYSGGRVRWGGVIVETMPGKDATCFQVVALMLDSRARPRPNDNSAGRFVACASGFWDPSIYAPKREVTVVGTIDGSVSEKIGDYDYTFPHVAAEVVYLWPERTYAQPAYYGGPYYWGPYWGPSWYPYFWGWYDPLPRPHRRW